LKLGCVAGTTFLSIILQRAGMAAAATLQRRRFRGNVSGEPPAAKRGLAAVSLRRLRRNRHLPAIGYPRRSLPAVVNGEQR